MTGLSVQTPDPVNNIFTGTWFTQEYHGTLHKGIGVAIESTPTLHSVSVLVCAGHFGLYQAVFCLLLFISTT